MMTLTSAASASLLNRKEEAGTHSIEKTGSSSAFSDYGFGPLELPDGDKEMSADGMNAKGVSGTSSIAAISGGTSAAFLTQLMASKQPGQ